MVIMKPPTGPIEISDPNNVPELFINGPFNVHKHGSHGTNYLHDGTARRQ